MWSSFAEQILYRAVGPLSGEYLHVSCCIRYIYRIRAGLLASQGSAGVDPRGFALSSPRHSVEFMLSASVFPRTFSCLVLSCRKTFLHESDRDEHIARNHRKSTEATAACRRLDDRMRFRLQLGRPSMSQTQTTEGIKEVVPTDESKISKSGDLGAESVTNAPKIETTTTSSWSPTA